MDARPGTAAAMAGPGDLRPEREMGLEGNRGGQGQRVVPSREGAKKMVP